MRSPGPGVSSLSRPNRQSVMDLLEWLSDEAAESSGRNLLDVEVLWAPAEAGEALDRDDLYTKWPDLRQLDFMSTL